jgi:hypothetical protein
VAANDVAVIRVLRVDDASATWSRIVLVAVPVQFALWLP